MKKPGIFIAFLLVSGPALFAQTPATEDSLTQMVQGYLLIEKACPTPGDNASVLELEKTVQVIGRQHDALSKSVSDAEGALLALEQARHEDQLGKYKKRLRKINQAPDFIKAANVSLSALSLSSSLTDYLGDVSSLNNPENEELGLSLQAAVGKIIGEKIFHGEAKAGKQKRGRFMSLVGSIVKSPLMTGLSGVIPVVSSLSAVTNLVSSVVADNEEIPIEDFEVYKKEIAGYVAFYEALGHAGSQFSNKTNNLGIRITVLENLVRNFTLERTEALYPGFAANNSIGVDINDLTRNYFERDAINRLIAGMEQDAVPVGATGPDLDLLLNDPRLAFPDFAVNQARFITDELQALSLEYIAAFQDYQTNIEQILNGAPQIVTPDKARKKSAALRSKLEHLEKSFHAAVHIEEVQNRFHKLSGISN